MVASKAYSTVALMGVMMAVSLAEPRDASTAEMRADKRAGKKVA